VLLFKKAFWDGLTTGAITLTFRRWQKPHVKPGGRYRCHPIGVLEVEQVALVATSGISADDAKAAGFETLDALLAYMASASEEPLLPTTEVFRVALRYGGDGDRVVAALDADLSKEDVALLRTKLAKMDAAGPWTKKTLAIIEAQPRVAASKLALQLRRDKLELKADIVKLKRLGLTQSFEVGYELSPRGQAYLAATRRPKKK